MNIKKKGYTLNDFYGIDPKNGIGVYQFKKGTCCEAKSGLGEFEWSNSKILKWAFNFFMKYS